MKEIGKLSEIANVTGFYTDTFTFYEPGWYNLLTSTILTPGGYRDYVANVDITLKRAYLSSNDHPEVHRVISVGPFSRNLTSIYDAAQTLLLTKLRISQDNESHHRFYIDVYYSGIQTNECKVLYQDKIINDAYKINWTSGTGTIVTSAVKTIYELELKANSWMGSEDSWPI